MHSRAGQQLRWRSGGAVVDAALKQKGFESHDKASGGDRAPIEPLCLIVVFAKAPIPGYAKTRLAPLLGDDGAARLAARLLRHAVEQACAAGIGQVEMCCAPDAGHPSFAALSQRENVMLSVQGQGDLGQRMASALCRSLAKYSRVLLIGADAPGLDAGYLRAAAHALLHKDAVFGPATDGGYTLVGLSRPANRLFESIPWSTPQVMDCTRDRLCELRMSHLELAPLSDIDEPTDLRHVPKEWLI